MYLSQLIDNCINHIRASLLVCNNIITITVNLVMGVYKALAEKNASCILNEPLFFVLNFGSGR